MWTDRHTVKLMGAFSAFLLERDKRYEYIGFQVLTTVLMKI
jgi:hypothetical protein